MFIRTSKQTKAAKKHLRKKHHPDLNERNSKLELELKELKETRDSSKLKILAKEANAIAVEVNQRADAEEDADFSIDTMIEVNRGHCERIQSVVSEFDVENADKLDRILAESFLTAMQLMRSALIAHKAGDLKTAQRHFDKILAKSMKAFNLAAKGDVAALVAAIQLVNVSAYMIVCYNRLEPDEVKAVEKVPLASMRPEIRNQIGETIRGHVDDLLAQVERLQLDEDSLRLVSDVLNVAYPIISQGLDWTVKLKNKLECNFNNLFFAECRISDRSSSLSSSRRKNLPRSD